MTSSFGDRLRLERENRQVTLEEIAARTEIDERFLRALERNEFDALPGQAFGKFYIRAYAAVLGFDPQALIADYDEARRRERPRAEPASRERPRRRVEAAMARWREARESARIEAEQPSDARDAPLAEPATDSLDDETETSQAEPAIAAPEPSFEAAAEPVPSAVEPEPAAVSVDEPGGPAWQGDPRPAPIADGDVSTAPFEPAIDAAGSAHDEAAALDALLGPATPAPAARLGRWALVAGALVVFAAVIGLVLRNGGGESAVPARPETVRTAAPETRSDAQERRAATALPPEPGVAVEPGALVPQAAVPAPVAAAPAPTRSAAEDVEESRAEGRLEIPEFGVGRRVANQRLQGAASRFEEGSVVVFWTRVVGGARGERIRHVWLHAGRPVQSVALELGGASWRTHSRKTLGAAGTWEVEARDAHDRVLARTSFECFSAGR